MTGLLGKIDRGLEGLLDSRLFQAAAVTGAAGPVGLLALPGIQDARNRRHLEAEELDERVGARRRSREAIDRLQGLLEEKRTVQAPPTPTVLDGLDDVTPLNIPGRRRSVPAISTPDGRLEAMGLLADVAPAIGAQGLLGAIQPAPARAEPPELRLIRALEDPSLNPGQKEMLRRTIAQRGGNDLLAAIELQRAQIALQQSQLDFRNDVSTQEQLEQDRRSTVARQSGNILSLAEKAAKLESQFLQPGAPLLEGREGLAGIGRIGGDLLGIDTPNLDKQVNSLGELRKGLADLAIDMQTRFEGTFTNDKLALLQRAMATTENDPATIRTILRQIGGLYLEKADQFSIKLDNREALERFVIGDRESTDDDDDETVPQTPLSQLGDDDIMSLLFGDQNGT